MTQLAFDFSDPTPAWAEACFYCTPDRLGRYDQDRHLHVNQALTCAVCGFERSRAPVDLRGP